MQCLPPPSRSAALPFSPASSGPAPSPTPSGRASPHTSSDSDDAEFANPEFRDSPGSPEGAAELDLASASHAAFSASISTEAFTHDARNLLTALGLYADLLNAPGVLSPRNRHYAQELRLLADRSTALLGRVLTPQCAHPPAGEQTRAYSQPTGAPARSEEPLCDPAVVLRRFLPLLQAQTEGAAQVVLRLPRETPPLPVSGETLERITANLVCNAAEAMRSAAREAERAGGCAGIVWIALQARDGMARLAVEDSGPGMPATAAAVLLRPETGNCSARRDGRGWGHRIVHSLVKETGGRLAVRPRPAGGTVVTVRWPLPRPSSVRLYAETPAAFREATVVAC